MRLLHLGDTHLGSVLHAQGAPPGWTRHQDHARALERALLPALAGEVDLVLHAGDVFNRSQPPPDVAQEATRLLEAAADVVPVVVIPGNHDRHGLGHSLASRHPGLHVLDVPARLRLAEVVVAAVPYRRDASDWARDARDAVGPGADILLHHQSLDGTWAPGIRFHARTDRSTVAWSQVPRGVGRLLGGHLHPRQVHRVGPHLAVYPGATERTSSVEAPQPKGVVRWDLDRDAFAWVDLPTRPMLRVGSRDDLAAVSAGSLVFNKRPDLTRDILAAGGWIVRRRPRQAQATSQRGLFPP